MSLLFVLLCAASVHLSAQYSEEAGLVRKLGDQYDQRGYANGNPLTVDGKLNLATSTGVPSYVYPVSSYTVNGHEISVALTYAGSVAHTTYHRYYLSAENVDGSWSKYHRTSPGWFLGVNGFAVQALAFSSTFVNDPAYMRYLDNANPNIGTKYTDKHFVWTIDGYDVCNRMEELEPPNVGNKHDVIRLLRADGSLLELRNVRSYDDITVNKNSYNPLLYVGEYYTNEPNPSALGIVTFDSSYIKPGVPPADPILLPRILRYYPGDGLEYVFREFMFPYGLEPLMAVWTNGRVGAGIYGGRMASPTIFYLTAINNGTETVLAFDYYRHHRGEQMFLHPDSSAVSMNVSRGRAPLKGFTGHTLIYGDNALTIQALGRSTTVFFSTAGYGAAYSGTLQEGTTRSPFLTLAQQGAKSITLQDTLGLTPSASYASWTALVTKIVDPEQRQTEFSYEKYTREYRGIGFPHDLNFSEEKPVVLAAWRLKDVVEPSAKQTLSYHVQTDTVLVASGSVLEDGDPATKRRLKYALTPTVRQIRKFDLSDEHLTTQSYDMQYKPQPPVLDFHPSLYRDHWETTVRVTDELTGRWSETRQDYRVFEFPTHENGLWLTFTQLFATATQADSAYTYTETHHARLDTMIIQPVASTTKAKHGPYGTWIVKKQENYTYTFAQVRSYATVPPVSPILGREIAERCASVVNVTSPYQTLYRTRTSYLHLPLVDTVMTARVRTWNKFKSRAELFQLQRLALAYGDTLDWEELYGCLPGYDTVEVNRLHHLPPVYNLELRSVVADGNDTILQGMGKRYALSFMQSDTASVYRGALLGDSIIGRGGVVIPATTYTYYGGRLGYYKSHMRTQQTAHGALKRLLYDYCSIPGAGGTIRKNDNSSELRALFGRRGIEEFESPLGEEKYVRAFTLGGVPNVRTLRTLMERTYYDQVSASIDPNGWYSRFDYDFNGRLRTAWLPYDFPGDSIYRSTWQGTQVVRMPGYTTRSWRVDTAACTHTGTIFDPIGRVQFRETDYSRLVAAWPLSVYPCGGVTRDAAPGKQEQVQTTARPIPYPNAQRHTGWFSGAASRELRDAIRIEEATLRLHVTKVVGKCINIRVSVLNPESTILNDYPKYDTLLTRVFVLNCERGFDALQKKSTAIKAPQGSGQVLGTTLTPSAYKLLELDLSSLRSDLLSASWLIAVAVETPGGEVEIVNDGADWQPQLEITGTFRSVDRFSDYTLRYEVEDRGRQAPVATAWAKVDDSLHTANTGIGAAVSPKDNSRYMNTQSVFGADYRVAVARETKQNGGVTWTDSVQTLYTGMGKARKSTDELGDTTSTVYDALGRPLRTYHADGTYTDYSYRLNFPILLLGDDAQDFMGYCEERRSTQVNTGGIVLVWRQYYDGFGRLRREIAPDSSATMYEYDVLGRLLAVVNPAGDTTRYWYDDFGRVKYKYQPDMGYISYAYDNTGNVRFTQTQAQADSARLTFTEYDDLGRVTLVGEARLGGSQGGGGHGIQQVGGKKDGVLFPAHPSVNLNRLTDQLDPTVLHDGGISGLLTANRTIWLPWQVPLPQFWTQNQLESTTCQPSPTLPSQPSGALLRHPVQYHIDPGLPLSSAENFEDIARYPQHARLAVQYDELPETGGSVWFFFPTAAQWNALAPKGEVRNLRGREAAVAYRSHAGEPYHFVVMSYDERGRIEALLRYTENLGFDAVYYTYNSMNLVTSVRLADPQRQFTTWYGYNANGRIDSVWTRLGAVGTGLGVATASYPAPLLKPAQADLVYDYSKRWQVDTLYYPPVNTLVAYAYNSRRWLDSLVASREGTMLFRQNLLFDAVGQITGQRTQHQGMPQERYEVYAYDKRGQLVAWEGGPTPLNSVGYSYDAVGNRRVVANTMRALTEYYQYSDVQHPNRLMQRFHRLDTTLYSYDADGALHTRTWSNGTAQTVETFGYDAIQGVVTRYHRWSGTPQGFGLAQEWRYRYSAGGEREQKRLYEGPVGEPKRWAYYALGGNKAQLAVYEGVETATNSCAGGDTHVYMWPTEYLAYGIGAVHHLTVRPVDTAGGVKEYKLQDHLGSTRVVLNQSGSVIGRYDYEPYGATLLPGPEPRRGFIDREKDDESGLGDFGVRKYDDGIGRFTSIDPLWEKFRAWSPYVYSYNSPVQFVDPSGESAVATVSEDGTTITVRATIYFYGEEVYSELNGNMAEKWAEAIQHYWNSAGKNVTINGKTYTVKFEITGKMVSMAEAQAKAKNNKDWTLNFVRVDMYNDDITSYVDLTTDRKLTNTGYWRRSQMTVNGLYREGMYNLPAHEFGHLLGYRAPDGDIHGKYQGGQPDLMDDYSATDMHVRTDFTIKPETMARIFRGRTLTPATTFNLGERLTNEIHKKGY